MSCLKILQLLFLINYLYLKNQKIGFLALEINYGKDTQ